MTNTNRAPRTCADCGTRLSSSNHDRDNGPICNVCFDAAGWENDHMDNGHDEAVANCPLCGTADRTTRTATSRVDSNRPTTNIDHSTHDHPRTSKARAACRKALAAS